MRGLKLHTPAYGRQHLAEGGLVQRIKQIVGLDPERNARIASYKAQKEAAAAASAAAPASTPEPTKAITDYTSGGATQRREKAAGLANGGMVRGPGTGTSDSVPDELPEGSYVLPADTTQAVGPQTTAMLDEMQAGAGGPPRGLRGAAVPVQLSNGEMKLMPEQVHAVGVQALDQMKNATHTPVPAARGLAGANQDPSRMFFANGGSVDEEAERLRNQTAAYVQGAQAAAAARPPVVANPVAAPMATPAPVQPGRFANTAAVARGATEDASAAFNQGNMAGAAGAAVRGALTVGPTAVAEGAYSAVAPVARGLAAFGRGLTGTTEAPAEPQMVSPPSTGTAVAAPVVSPDATQPVSAPMAVKSVAPPGPAGIDGVRPGEIPVVDTQVAPGVFRSGNSFGDTQAAANAGAAPRGLPSAQNNAAAEALAARSQADSAGRVAAAAPAARGMPGVQAGAVPNTDNSWLARNNMRNLEVSAASITNNGGRFDPTKGNNAAQAALKTGLANDAAARAGQVGMDRAALDANAGLQREQVQQQGGLDREAVQQTGANTRSARGLAVDRERLGIDRTRAASENAQREVATAGAQQLQNLRNVLLNPDSTPEQRKQAETSLRAIGGKAEAANRYTVVPGGQEINAQGVPFTRPSQVLDNSTGRFVDAPGAAAPQGGAARPTSKAEYDSLPKGASYVKPDGKTYIKG